MSDIKLYLGGLLICVIALPIFGCVFKWQPGMVSPYLLFLTLAAIFWYSYETRGLKKQMVKQNELSLRPRLIFYAIAGQIFWVKNIGNGAALDIIIEDYSLELPGNGKILFKFECQNILESGEASQLNVKMGEGENSRDTPPFWLAQLRPISALRTLEIKMKYKNVLGREYDKDKSTLGKEMLQRVSICR